MPTPPKNRARQAAFRLCSQEVDKLDGEGGIAVCADGANPPTTTACSPSASLDANSSFSEAWMRSDKFMIIPYSLIVRFAARIAAVARCRAIEFLSNRSVSTPKPTGFSGGDS